VDCCILVEQFWCDNCYAGLWVGRSDFVQQTGAWLADSPAEFCHGCNKCSLLQRWQLCVVEYVRQSHKKQINWFI